MNVEQHIVEELEEALPVSRKGVPIELLRRPTIDKLLLHACQDWALILLSWFGIAVGPLWVYPIFVLLAASRFHSLGVIVHDIAHMQIRVKTPKTRLLEVISGYPVATTLNAIRYHHLRHHRDSGMQTDPYFKANIEERPLVCTLSVLRGLLLWPFWLIRCVVGSIAFYKPAMRNAYARIFLQDVSGSDLAESREVIQCAAEDRWQFIFFIAVSPIAFINVTVTFYGYLIPVIIAGGLAAHRLLMEHRYEASTDRRIETILAATRDHNLSGLGRFIFAPRNIGYHIVHHLHPQVAWDALPALRLWYRDQYPQTYPQQARSSLHVVAVILGREND